MADGGEFDCSIVLGFAGELVLERKARHLHASRDPGVLKFRSDSDVAEWQRLSLSKAIAVSRIPGLSARELKNMDCIILVPTSPYWLLQRFQWARGSLTRSNSELNRNRPIFNNAVPACPAHAGAALLIALVLMSVFWTPPRSYFGKQTISNFLAPDS